MLPPPAGTRRAAHFGQRSTETRDKEQRSTLAVALALAAGGYLLLQYTKNW